MTLLKLKGISKRYSSSKSYAVRDLDLDVEEGEIVALIGESGSGKTTLLRLIAGLEHPNTGSIRLLNKEIVSGSFTVPAHERQIGMVFQDYALFPHLTLLENVCYGLKGAKKDQETVAMNTLRLVGLQESVKKYPHQLSGGQQQRVALARAIAPNPKILLMDEPFSNLDAVLKDQVREEIRLIIKKTGITAIFVTHDTRDALSTADRIAILHQGRLQQVDVPRTLYEQPANGYVANFFGKQNAILASATTEGFYTDFGYIADPRAAEFRTKVQLLFRPEHAQLLPETKKTDNFDQPLLFGRLYKVNYYGDHQIVKLSDEFGKRISIRVAADMVLPESGLLAFRLLRYTIAEAF